MANSGYLYCMSNAAMPEMYKVGYTERDPTERLKEANQHDTWRPPCPYVIEFAKWVTDVKEKEKTLHKVLAETRVSERQEFFRLELSQIKLLFSLTDGDWWTMHQPLHSASATIVPQSGKDTPDPVAPAGDEDQSSLGSTARTNRKKLRDYLKDGQKVRHTLGEAILESIYNARADRLYIGTIPLKTLHELVHHHESIVKKKASNKGHWKQCECEVNGTWKIMEDMSPLHLEPQNL